VARKHFSRTDRVRIFDLNGGKCHICGLRIQAGDVWELEHIVPWELTRDDSDQNVKPAHYKCHKGKTAVDVGNISKADRVRAKFIGAWPKSQAKIKSPGFRKTRG
jgi:5-methylcytosine-specific restriction protein A